MMKGNSQPAAVDILLSEFTKIYVHIDEAKICYRLCPADAGQSTCEHIPESISILGIPVFCLTFYNIMSTINILHPFLLFCNPNGKNCIF